MEGDSEIKSVGSSYNHINVREYRKDNQKCTIQRTGNTGHTRRRKTQHNTICVGHYYTSRNTNNVYKTRALLQTTGGKDEPNIIFMLFKISKSSR